jgi:hypothetical protein
MKNMRIGVLSQVEDPGLYEKLAAWIQKVQMPAGVSGRIEVAHDGHCDRLRDESLPCTCEPDFTFVPVVFDGGKK